MNYVDANLFHDQITGRAVTGILHLVNKNPMDRYYKQHSTVEKATYGSEFFSYCKCAEHIIYLRNTIQYLGVPICHKN